jgi:hypothetical protein
MKYERYKDIPAWVRRDGIYTLGSVAELLTLAEHYAGQSDTKSDLICLLAQALFEQLPIRDDRL